MLEIWTQRERASRFRKDVAMISWGNLRDVGRFIVRSQS